MLPAASSLAADRLTAAFARVADARYAIGILQSCGMAPHDFKLETVDDGRGGVSIRSCASSLAVSPAIESWRRSLVATAFR